MSLRTHHSEFAENWAIQFVPKASTPMGTDRKTELLSIQTQNQETVKHAPLELEPAHSDPLFLPENHFS